MRILVVQDKSAPAAELAGGLQAQGFEVDTRNREDAVQASVSGDPYDLVVLDPDRKSEDPFHRVPKRTSETCRDLRDAGCTAPILIVSELDELEEKVAGLDAGADDYLTKPVQIEEFLARIRALLRRARLADSAKLEYGDLELDLIRRVVLRQGKRITLSSREVAVLEFLIRNADQVVTRPVIARGVWDRDYEPSSNVIDVYISNLRKKIDKGFEEPLIHTVVGTGYLFGSQARV